MIRLACEKDLDDILDIHRRAFEEEDEADLVAALFQDASAQPILSLVGEMDGSLTGHILLTKVEILGTEAKAMLLAPLAVDPDFHFKGWGQRLMKEAFKRLRETGVELVFVLGDPAYYPRVGFIVDAQKQGFLAPHPIPGKYRDAWMVCELQKGALAKYQGTLKVADKIAPYEFWCD